MACSGPHSSQAIAGRPRLHGWSVAQQGRLARRGQRRTPRGCHGRGDPHPRRGSGARPGHHRRQPGVVHTRCGKPRRSSRRPRLHGEHRPVAERDHASCRRDPAATQPTRTEPLRPRVLRAVGAQHRELVSPALRQRVTRRGRDPRPTRDGGHGDGSELRPRSRPRPGARHLDRPGSGSGGLAGPGSRPCRCARSALGHPPGGSRARGHVALRALRRWLRHGPWRVDPGEAG